MLGDWMGTASFIWALKYEGWREPFEIKGVEGVATGGEPLSYASLEVVKGCGRLSVLMFSLFYTYLHLKNMLTDEELESLKQHLDTEGYMGISQSYRIPGEILGGILGSSLGSPCFQIFEGDGGTASVVFPLLGYMNLYIAAYPIPNPKVMVSLPPSPRLS